MLYWECKRRLKSLREFRQLVADYFSNIEFHGFYDPEENGVAQRARTEINYHMGDILYSCNLIGLTCDIYYSPPPAVGGVAGPLNLISNIFQLWRFQIPAQQVFDCLDNAIGRYERHKRWLYRQMFNPMFWIKWLLIKLLSIPFGILNLAGFNAEKIEKSLVGKFVKAVVGFVAFVAPLLAVLDYLGLLESLKKLLAR